MSKFCKLCGKQIADDEVCNCASGQQSQPQNQFQQPQQPQQQWQAQPQQPQQQWQAQPQQPQQQWQQPQQQWAPQGQSMAAPKPSAVGNAFGDLGQLLREFFIAPVTAVVNQMKKGSFVLALIIIIATAFVSAVFAALFTSPAAYIPNNLWDAIGSYVRSPILSALIYFFRALLSEAAYFGLIGGGLALCSSLFAKKNVDFKKGLIAIACAGVLLPVANVLAFIPYVGGIISSTISIATIIIAVLAFRKSEQIDDNKMVYIAVLPMACYYIINTLIFLIR